MLSVEEMIDRANMAQKSVKEGSGNRFAFYSDRMRCAVLREKELEASMEGALHRGEFRVRYQPQIDIQGYGRIVGAEALAYWRREGGELLRPGEFIPLFEKNGFVVQLDHYVFEQACKYLAARRERGKGNLRISVNASRITMLQEEFVQHYARIKDRYGIRDGQIEIESTESAFVQDRRRMLHTLSQLREHGFRCAMDDFGTGYSSLILLKDMPFDVLKLDIGFFQRGRAPSGTTP